MPAVFDTYSHRTNAYKLAIVLVISPILIPIFFILPNLGTIAMVVLIVLLSICCLIGVLMLVNPFGQQLYETDGTITLTENQVKADGKTYDLGHYTKIIIILMGYRGQWQGDVDGYASGGGKEESGLGNRIKVYEHGTLVLKKSFSLNKREDYEQFKGIIYHWQKNEIKLNIFGYEVEYQQYKYVSKKGISNKKWILLAIVALVSCNNSRKSSNPLIFSVRLDANSPYYLCLIMGSDTQNVDSLYLEKFAYMVRYPSYYQNDTLRVERIILKHYFPNDFLLKINNYVNQNRKNGNSCDSFGVKTDCILITYGKDNKQIKTCMMRKELASFFQGLTKELSLYPVDSDKHILSQDLNTLYNSNTFTPSIQQLQNERNRMRSKNSHQSHST